jgi:hypothetical protein
MSKDKLKPGESQDEKRHQGDQKHGKDERYKPNPNPGK